MWRLQRDRAAGPPRPAADRAVAPCPTPSPATPTCRSRLPGRERLRPLAIPPGDDHQLTRTASREMLLERSRCSFAMLGSGDEPRSWDEASEHGDAGRIGDGGSGQFCTLGPVQAFVDQKNGAMVRRIVGYRRLEVLDAAAVLAELYRSVRLFVNHFAWHAGPSGWVSCSVIWASHLAARRVPGWPSGSRCRPARTPCCG